MTFASVLHAIAENALAIALVVAGALVLAGAAYVWFRSRRASSVGAVWRSFSRSLPAAARGLPLTILLGERASGKSSVLRAVVEGAAGEPYPSLAADPRIACYAAGGQLFQELAESVLAAEDPDTRRALAHLWGPVRWQAPRLVAVVNASSPSWTPGGLAALGASLRSKADVLARLRGQPVRVRVCLTHVDLRAPGFVEVVRSLAEVGIASRMRLTGATGAELAKAFEPLAPAISAGLRDGSPAQVVEFLAVDGPAIALALEPLLRALLDVRAAAAAPPVLDGVFLAAANQGAFLGAPLALDAIVVGRERDVLARRRFGAALAVGVTSAALATVAYGVHALSVLAAGRAVEAMTQGMASQGASAPEAAALEKAASAALDRASTPLWPPLAWAYPGRKARNGDAFVAAIRRNAALPVATRTDRASRAYGLSFLFASSPGEGLGAMIAADPHAWAQHLSVDDSLVDDALGRVRTPWSDALPRWPATASSADRVDPAEWSRWLADVRAASSGASVDAASLVNLQRRASALAKALGNAADEARVAAIVAELGRERRVDVATVFGPDASTSNVPAWAAAAAPALGDWLSRVTAASLAVPSAKGKGMREALDALDAISAEVAVTGTDTFVADGVAYTLDRGAFEGVVRSTRAAMYMAAYESDVRASGRVAFFGDAPAYPPDGVSAIEGRGPTRPIRGIFTADAFTAEVRPALSDLRAHLGKTALSPRAQADFALYATRAAQSYAAAYAGELSSYFASFRLTSPSVSMLRADANAMLGQPSWFSSFLEAVARTASVDAGGDALVAMACEGLGEWRAIANVMAGDAGKLPNLEKYLAVVAALGPSLDAAAPGAKAGAGLDDRLAPVGKLAAAALVSDKGTPLGDLRAWLDAMAIPSSQQAPFTRPFQLAYGFGASDVERAVAQSFDQDVRPTVAQLLTQFPFNRASEADAQAGDVEAALGPKGTFFTAFDAGVGPACARGSDGTWSGRVGAFGRRLRVPDDALRLARWATRLSTALWRGDAPEPIAIWVKPMPLEKVAPRETVTLAFVRTGKATEYAFNQTPRWRALQVMWWNEDTASVGFRLTKAGDDEQRDESLDAPPSDFSFYRLLEKGAWRGRRVGWAVPGDAAGRTVSFTFRQDPWALFDPGLPRKTPRSREE